MFLSVSLLPFCFLLSIVTDVLQQLSLFAVPSAYTLLLVTGGVILLLGSVALAIASIVCYTRSKRAGTDVAGFILSIVSLVLCVIAIVVATVTLLA